MTEVGPQKTKRCLITGVSGFIGQALASELADDETITVAGTYRGLKPDLPVLTYEVPEIHENTDWSAPLQDVEIVVHLAGRAHVLNEQSVDALEEFRRVNVKGSLALARQSIKARVQRFIFISSIGVNGSHTDDVAFCEQTLPAPSVDYAVSKYEAEQALQKIFKGTSVELVIIRPPLVYGAHAPGNFEKLMRIAYYGVPLPFGLVKNRRSMVALENLIDFIEICMRHPAAANQTFLVSDGVDISTPQLLRYISTGMGRKTPLIPVPVFLLHQAARLFNKMDVYRQLCGSLLVDTTKAQELLGWQPPVGPADALAKAGREYWIRHDN